MRKVRTFFYMTILLCTDFGLYAPGNWIGATSLPDDSLEQSELNLKGEDKAQFLRFVRKMVTWKPEDRCSAEELLDDPWLVY